MNGDALDDFDDLLGPASPVDRPIRFSVFRGADLPDPEPRTMSLREIAEMIRQTEVSAEVAAGVRHPLIKLATFTGPRCDENLDTVTGVELDLDRGEVTPEEAVDHFAEAGILALVYTSRSHTPAHPKIRVLLPLSRPVAAAERRGYALQAAAVLGAEVDRVSFTASQAFYYAGVTGRERVVTLTPDGVCLDEADLPPAAEPLSSAQPEDDDEAELLRMAGQARQQRDFETDLASGKLQSALDGIEPDALDYHNIVRIGMALHYASGATPEALEMWRSVANRSYWYESMVTGEPQAGGPNAGKVADLNGRRASPERIAHYQNKLWRGFNFNRRGDVVGLGSVYDMAEKCGWSRSSVALADLEALDDLDPFDSASDDLDDLLGPPTEDDNPIDRPVPVDPGVNPNRDWKSALAITEEGEVKVCLHNVELIVRNDARLWGRLGTNELLQAKVFVREPAPLRKKARDGKPIKQLVGPIWRLKESRHAIDGRRWTDDHDNSLRSVLEAPGTQGGYGIKVSDRDLRAAVANVANDHTFHPIRDRLRELIWDGEQRVESLFVDYLGCPDDPYHRGVARLMLLGAVARVMEPGHKFDYMVILEGVQGARKSTFVRILALDWFSELVYDARDANKMIEALQGAWILEVPELEGFSKADTTSLKAFISKIADKGRLAWERSVRDFPRQCILIGTTNEEEYLKDRTGGRRFLPVKVLVDSIDTDRLRREIEQIWAEAVEIYDAMRAEQPHGDLPLYLSDAEAAATAKREQEARRQETPEDILAGEIAAVLDEPESTDLDGVEVVRQQVCVKEVWIDLLERDPKALESQITTRLIGKAMRAAGWAPATTLRHPKYGLQKAFRRKQ